MKTPAHFTLLFLLALAAGLAPRAARAQDVGAGTPINDPKPAGVRIIADLAYVEHGAPRQKLDLYLPVPVPAKPMPVILYFHGGGWQKGSKADARRFAFRMAAQGYAVASIGYRLSSEAEFPTQLEDCKVAVRWLREYAVRYRLDPYHFGAYGVSAGGYLAALVGLTANVHLLDTGEHLGQPSGVQAVCDFFGPFDLLQLYDYAQEHQAPQAEEISRLLGGNPHSMKEQNRTASPRSYLGADAPPFLLVHGAEDTVIPPEQSRGFYDALAKEHITAHLHLIHGAGHTGPAFVAPEINALVDDFFARLLKPETNPTEGIATRVTESSARKD